MDLFAACFTREGDSLSQWWGYGDDYILSGDTTSDLASSPAGDGAKQKTLASRMKGFRRFGFETAYFRRGRRKRAHSGMASIDQRPTPSHLRLCNLPESQCRRVRRTSRGQTQSDYGSIVASAPYPCAVR